MPQSVTVCLLRQSSCWILGQIRGARCRTWWIEFPGRWVYASGIMSRGLRLSNLPPNRYINSSGILSYAHQVISRPQVLHCTLLRSKLTSFKKCIDVGWSEKRNVRNIIFAPPASRSIRRPYDDFGTNDIPRSRSYSATTSHKRWTILLSAEDSRCSHRSEFYTSNGCETGGGSVLLSGCFIKNPEKTVNTIHVLCW